MSFVFLLPYFRPTLDYSQYFIKCLNARLMVVALLRGYWHNFLLQIFLIYRWVQGAECVVTIEGGGPTINRKFKLSSGNLDTDPTMLSQEALSCPIGWFWSVLSSVGSNWQCLWGLRESMAVSNLSYVYSGWPQRKEGWHFMPLLQVLWVTLVLVRP